MRTFRMNIKVLCSIAAILILSGCSVAPGYSTPQSTSDPKIPHQTIIQAEVVFQVDIPPVTPEPVEIFLDILDEVTGLAINPDRHLLEPIGSNRFVTRIPVKVGSVLQYRYGRDGNPSSIEYTASGQQVRYRILKVTGPMVVEDIVSAWTDLAYKGKSGRISGKVQDSRTSAPIANILVAAGGTSTYTSADGSFLLEGLSEGTHRIVAYSPDGTYDVFQQGATVAVDSLTPAIINLVKLPTVRLTFNVSMPPGTLRGIPVRLIGNIHSLGNTFTDLSGGFSTTAVRAPLMILQANGTYSLTLELPAGLDLRYKYTLGDGFWNSELTSNGSFRTRQLVVPEKDSEITDTVLNWMTPDKAAVTFTVKVPDNTPDSDTVFIQFNPYDWTEPIPMWSLGANEWMYILFNPLSIVDQVSYRYCRNGMCGIADENPGNPTSVRSFSPGTDPVSLQDEVGSWTYWNPSSSPTTIVASEIKGRGDKFLAGIELSSYYTPNVQSQIHNTFDGLRKLGANWLFLTPSWTYTRNNPPVLEMVPGRDPAWLDLQQTIGWAHDKNLKVAIYPHWSLSNDQWWNTASRNQGWWESWFDRYETFLVHYALLATQSNAEALILGEPTIGPGITGLLPNGTTSAAPSNKMDRWKKIIEKVRTLYKGPIYWAAQYPKDTQSLPAFIGDLDGIYILWSAPLSLTTQTNEAAIVKEIIRLLDQDLVKIKEKHKKPLFIGIDHASIDGSARTCVELDSKCLPFSFLNQPFRKNTTIKIDLDEQLSIYNAFLTAINQRNWIDGFISRGYFPAAALQDMTSSVRGKPAEDILWYWFPRLTAKP